jgi:hypothetical protein
MSFVPEATGSTYDGNSQTATVSSTKVSVLTADDLIAHSITFDRRTGKPSIPGFCRDERTSIPLPGPIPSNWTLYVRHDLGQVETKTRRFLLGLAAKPPVDAEVDNALELFVQASSVASPTEKSAKSAPVVTIGGHPGELSTDLFLKLDWVSMGSRTKV